MASIWRPTSTGLQQHGQENPQQLKKTQSMQQLKARTVLGEVSNNIQQQQQHQFSQKRFIKSNTSQVMNINFWKFLLFYTSNVEFLTSLCNLEVYKNF